MLHPEKTLFQELQDTWPDMNTTEVRNMLAAFLFTGDDAMKRVADLSGGERGRVSLAKLMLSHANLLVLDEPTNHLDMASKEILESAIREFPGTVLCVSHDRYFINRTATRILELKQGKLLNYIGNYDYYLEKRADVEKAAGIISDPRLADQRAAGSQQGSEKRPGSPAGSAGKGQTAVHLNASGSSAGGAGNAWNSGNAGNAGSAGNSGNTGAGTASAPQTSSKADWEAEKVRKAKEKKRRQALEACEAKIQKLEETLSGIEEQFLDPALQRDAAALLSLQRDKEAAEASLEELYAEWETLAEPGEE